MFFTSDLQVLPLLIALPVVAAFGWLTARASRSRWAIPVLVALGAGAAGRPAAVARRRIEPWSDLVILPAFAFVAALVPLPPAGQLSPLLLAIVLATAWTWSARAPSLCSWGHWWQRQPAQS